jgi:hypothetical protein
MVKENGAVDRVAPQNPLKLYALAMLFWGVPALIVSLWTLIEIRSMFRTAIGTNHIQGDEFYYFQLVVAGITSCFWLVMGGHAILLGIHNLGRLVVPQEVPAEIDLDDVKATFETNKNPLYKSLESIYLSLAYKYKREVQYLTKSQRQVVAADFSFSLNTIFLVAVIILGRGFFPDSTFNLIGIQLGFGRVPIIFLIILFVVAAIKIFSARSLIPDDKPSDARIKTYVGVRGGGDWSSLAPAIEQACANLFGEVKFQKDFDEKAGIITGTGRFKEALFIETEPILVNHRPQKAVFVYLVAGGLLLIAALSILTITPVRVAMESGQLMSVISDYSWRITEGILFTRLGFVFYKQAHRLLGTLRFESVMVFAQSEGILASAKNQTGKASGDSIGVEKTGVSSDFSLSVYTASVLSENYIWGRERYIIEMFADANAQKTQRIVANCATEFQKTRMVLHGIDLEAESTTDIIGANLSIEQKREQIKSSSTSEHRIGGSDQKQIRESAEASPNQHTDGN